MSPRRTGRRERADATAVLRERAAAVRRRTVDRPLPVARDHITFDLAEERHGVPVEQVVRIQPLAGLAAVPGASPRLLGLVAVNEQPVAVVSLGPVDHTLTHAVILAGEVEGEVIAVAVSGSVGIEHVWMDQLASAGDVSAAGTRLTTGGELGRRARSAARAGWRKP